MNEVEWRKVAGAWIAQVGETTVVVSMHMNGGWQWCTNRPGGPSGYDPELDAAKAHAVEFTEQWLADVNDVLEGRKPIPDEWLDAHDETAEIVAAAVAQERAAVFEYLSELAVNSDTVEMERVLLEAAGDIHRGEHRKVAP